MDTIYREGRPDDFEEWFAMECACFGRGTGWRNSAKREWNVFFQSGAFLTLTLEENDGQAKPRMAAFGAGAFVSDAFVAHLEQKPAPGVLVHATNRLPDGSFPLLNPAAIRAANAGEGLNFLLTHWTWAAPRLDEAAAQKARTGLNEYFYWMHGGYKIKSLLSEGFGESHRDRSLAAGFEIFNDYQDYYRANFEKLNPGERSYLMRACRDRMKDGSLLCRSFNYTPPRFGFTPRQREILRMARAGESNSVIRARIGISETAFKKHWDRLYAKVREIMPEMLPSLADDSRCKVSRLTLTHYLQKHPEELRP